MRILVTGCAGFIGSHTSARLLDRGDEVVGLDNLDPSSDLAIKRDRLSRLVTREGFSFVGASILDRSTLAKAMRGADRVCHLAAISGVRLPPEDSHQYISANIQGFFHIVEEAARQRAGGLVYASSSAVYGASNSLPYREDDRADRPVSLYGMTKRDNELLARVYHHLHGLHVTGLRFFTVYGPWGRPDMALSLFTDAILRGEPLTIFGHGRMSRDFTYIDDVVTAILAALDRNHKEAVINLGSGRQEQLLDFIDQIESCCGRPAHKNLVGAPPSDPPATWADISLARELLGFAPETTIDQGIPAFVEWFREYYQI